MNNLKSLTITQDGASKRISVTFDVVDENGKVTKPNKRINRVITDSKALTSVTNLEKVAAALMEE